MGDPCFTEIGATKLVEKGAEQESWQQVQSLPADKDQQELADMSSRQLLCQVHRFVSSPIISLLTPTSPDPTITKTNSAVQSKNLLTSESLHQGALLNRDYHIDVRKQLILKEVLGYNADIVCFQECDDAVFQSYYQHHMRLDGTKTSITVMDCRVLWDRV